MDIEILSQNIADKFGNQAEFVRKFNEATGVNLTVAYLNRQLKGKVPLMQGWAAAYRLFFLYCG